MNKVQKSFYQDLKSELKFSGIGIEFFDDEVLGEMVTFIDYKNEINADVRVDWFLDFEDDVDRVVRMIKSHFTFRLKQK